MWALAYFNGSDQVPTVPPSINTQIRQQTVQEILNAPGLLDTNLTNIFKSHIAECRAYVTAKGEYPSNDPVILASQVCLLRAQDIATQAAAIGISDEESLQAIELAEAACQDTGNPDEYSTLSFAVQSAVKIVLDKLSAMIPGGTMSGLINLLRGQVSSSSLNGFSTDTFTSASLITRNQPKKNNADGIDLAVVDPGSVAPISIAGETNTSLLSPDATAAAPQGSGILDFLTGIVNNAGNIAGAVGAISQDFQSSTSAAKGVFTNLGAGSIGTYVQQNKGSIIAIALIAIVAIFIIVYAAKHSN